MNRSRFLGCCIALLSAGTFAQENPYALRVPLFSPGPPIAATDPIRQSPQAKSPDFVAMQAIVLNEDAFWAGAVTVEIDGKVHKFVGGPKPKRQVLPGQKDHTIRWGGEEEDDGYGRPYLSLSKDEITGQVTGGLSIPPRRFFTIYSGSPSVLIESMPEWNSVRPRAPLWLSIGLFPILVGLGIVFHWQRFRKRVGSVRSKMSTRLAFASAGMFAIAWMLCWLTFFFLQPNDHTESWNDRAHVFGLHLSIAAICYGLIFWRVRIACAKRNASVLRAAIEGYCGAAILVLALVGAEVLVNISRGLMPFDGLGYWHGFEDALPLLIAFLVGSVVGVALWGSTHLMGRSVLVRPT